MGEIQMEATVARLDSLLRRGLGSGIREVAQRRPWCLEQAVAVATGESKRGHDVTDTPDCVAPTLSPFGAGLNDMLWSSNQARARGLRRLGIAQLGSAGLENPVWTGCALVLARKIRTELVPTHLALHLPESDAVTNLIETCRDERVGEKMTLRAFVEVQRVVLDDIDLVEVGSALMRIRREGDLGNFEAVLDRLTELVRETSFERDREADAFYTAVANTVVEALREVGAPGAVWLANQEGGAR